jgi:hypothetical protein
MMAGSPVDRAPIESPARHRTADMSGDPAFRAMAAQIHSLGPRVAVEILAELSAAHGPAVLETMRQYAGLNLPMLAAIGGDRIPPLPGPRRVV